MTKRLIDVNQMLENIELLARHEDTFRQSVILGVAQTIRNAPTVDAVEVVRKPIKGYEGYYEVDQFGRCFGCDRVVPVDDMGEECAVFFSHTPIDEPPVYVGSTIDCGFPENVVCGMYLPCPGTDGSELEVSE